MKKQTVLLSALLFLHGFAPVGYGIARAIGWEFLIYSELPFFLGLTIITLTVTVRLKWSKHPTALVVALYPVSIVNSVICLWITKSLMAIPCVAVFVICCGTLFRELAPVNIWRKLVSVLSVLLVLALIVLSAVVVFADGFGYIEVIQQIDSPEGTYTAQLIEVNEGALGGATLVKIWDNARTVHLGPTCLTPAHQEAYRGDWGEFMDMTLSWQDDSTLLINERAYPIG